MTRSMSLFAVAALAALPLTTHGEFGVADTPPVPDGMAVATFAGGCFWCMEPPYDEIDGVVSTTSGYIAGDVEAPTYKQVSRGDTGHAEALRVIYDPEQVSYETLLEVFWRNIDPTVSDRQFCDVGSQYRTGIFVHDDAQRAAAEASLATVRETKPFDAPIVTPIAPATEFWPAEDYHQDYYRKNPVKYKFYRYSCGRDARLKELWGGDRG